MISLGHKISLLNSHFVSIKITKFDGWLVKFGGIAIKTDTSTVSIHQQNANDKMCSASHKKHIFIKQFFFVYGETV